MNDCEIVLSDITLKSNAKRFFWLFKPSELIEGEPFDFTLTFKNNGPEKFKGGTCKFNLKGKLTYDFQNELSAIEVGQTTTVEFSDVILAENGLIGFTNFIIKPSEGGILSVKSKTNNQMTENHAIPFSMASREELYQKYAVIVAALFSIIATGLTIVNLVVAFWL